VGQQTPPVFRQAGGVAEYSLFFFPRKQCSLRKSSVRRKDLNLTCHFVMGEGSAALNRKAKRACLHQAANARRDPQLPFPNRHFLSPILVPRFHPLSIHALLREIVCKVEFATSKFRPRSTLTTFARAFSTLDSCRGD